MSEYLEIYENGDRFGTISASGEVRILEVSTTGVPELKHGEKLPIPEDMINSIERRIEAAKLNHARDLQHNEQMMAQAASSFDKAKQEKDARITDLENELEQAKLQSTEPTERSVQQWFFDKCITIERDTDSVRDAWFEARCICDGFHTTGNESVVEEAAYEHVGKHMDVEDAAYAHVDKHIDVNMIADREVFQVLDLGDCQEDDNFDKTPLDPPLLAPQEVSSVQQANTLAQSRANTTRRPQMVQRKRYTRWESLNRAEPNEAPALDPEVHPS